MKLTCSCCGSENLKEGILENNSLRINETSIDNKSIQVKNARICFNCGNIMPYINTDYLGKDSAENTNKNKVSSTPITGSDALKTSKRKDLEFFFGKDIKMVSGNYFRYTGYINDNQIIVLVNPSYIKKIKDNMVLLISKDEGVFLKNWQIRKVSNYQNGIDCYAVKLNREYYKPFKFNFQFEEASSLTMYYNFDEWIQLAKTQDLQIREGWSR